MFKYDMVCRVMGKKYGGGGGEGRKRHGQRVCDTSPASGGMRWLKGERGVEQEVSGWF